MTAYNFNEDCEKRFRDDIFTNHEYDFGIPDKKGMVVVDLGAHVGLFTEYIYPKAWIVYCIEAQRDNYNRLMKRLSDKQLTGIFTFNIAIGGKNETRRLYSNGRDGDFSLMFENSKYEEVQTITLNDFIRLNKIPHIDLLKIDIEGGEKEVFGSTEFAKLVPIIDNIVGESHGNMPNDVLEKALVGFGYKVTFVKNLFSAKRL